MQGARCQVSVDVISRQRLVEALLLDRRLTRVPSRNWALEAALGRLLALSRTDDLPTLHRWATSNAFGPRFPGLDAVVWSLVAKGVLHPAPRLPAAGYVVDEWWRDEALSRDGHSQAAGAVVKAGAYLASLCASRNTVSKTSNTG